MFSDVLLTVDYDRTLTGPDSVVPERNWEAIRYFMENGSAQWDKDHLIDLKIIDLDMWAVLDEVGANFPEMNLEIQATDNHYLLDAPAAKAPLRT